MSKAQASESVSPVSTAPGSRLRLYSTLGCHLCDEAVAILGSTFPELLAELEVVDIADDPELMDVYDVRIPVLQLIESGAEIGWPFGPEELREFVRPDPA